MLPLSAAAQLSAVPGAKSIAVQRVEQDERSRFGLEVRGPVRAFPRLEVVDRHLDAAATIELGQVLDRLGEREPPLIVQLPRLPGQKEERFQHLLAGEPDLEALAAAAPTPRPASGGLADRVAVLEAEVAALRERLEALEGDD